MTKKEEAYKRVKIAGLLIFIPLVLAISPLAGFLTAQYLREKFHLGNYIIFILVGLGFLAGVRETVRIIKLAIKIEKKS